MTTLGSAVKKPLPQIRLDDMQSLANAGSWLCSRQNQALPFLLHVSKGLEPCHNGRGCRGCPKNIMSCSHRLWLWSKSVWHSCNQNLVSNLKRPPCCLDPDTSSFVGLFEPSIQDGQDLHLIWCLFFVPARNHYSNWTESDGSSLAHFDLGISTAQLLRLSLHKKSTLKS